MNAASLHSDEALRRHQQLQRQRQIEITAHRVNHDTCTSGRILAAGPYGASQPDQASLCLQNQDLVSQDIAEGGSMSSVKYEVEGSTHGDGTDLEISMLPADYSETSASTAYSSASHGALVATVRPVAFPASDVGLPGEDGARQIARLQGKLAQRLGPEYIATKPGPSGAGKVPYLEGYKAIDLANEVFGFNGWSTTIVRLDIDFLDELEGRRFNVGVSSIVRVTLRDGTYHEDCGYGNVENMKSKAQAIEKAKKEAVTDANKRALRTFGRLLGNCLYDKKFTETAMKIKVDPPKYDASEFKRGPEVTTRHQQVAPEQTVEKPCTVTTASTRHQHAASRKTSVGTHAAPSANVTANGQLIHEGEFDRGALQKVSEHGLPGQPAVAKMSTDEHPKSTSPNTSLIREDVAQNDADMAAREKRRAQAAARQAELRKRQAQQNNTGSTETHSPQEANIRRSPLQPTSVQASRLSPQHRHSSQGNRIKASPSNKTPSAPRDGDLFFDDISFSQCSEDPGLDAEKLNPKFQEAGATRNEAAEPTRKAIRQGRFASSPTSAFKSAALTDMQAPTYVRGLAPEMEEGRHSLAKPGMAEKYGNSPAAMAGAKRMSLASASHVARGADKRSKHAPA